LAKILLIETATAVCSAAIAVDGAILALEEAPDTASHAATLTPQIESCLQQTGLTLADLDAIAVSRGPGSYTSLRVGIGVAKGICYALNKPLIAIDTLQALALASIITPHSSLITHRSSLFYLPMLDARRQEVWTAAYDAEGKQLIPAQPLILEHNLFETFINNIDLCNEDVRFVLSGNGTVKAKSVIFAERTVWSEITACSARYLGPLAERFFQQHDFQDIAYFEPFYMKPPNITTPNKVL
jgi:tRNA threonylcarbamoyladenosine biosynthesis protein TsaB